jgi:GDP-mannose 6-dehydrogenase
MVPTVDEVLAHAQTVVIGNRDPEFSKIYERLREDQCLVDFVRITRQEDRNVPQRLTYA